MGVVKLSVRHDQQIWARLGERTAGRLGGSIGVDAISGLIASAANTCTSSMTSSRMCWKCIHDGLPPPKRSLLHLPQLRRLSGLRVELS